MVSVAKPLGIYRKVELTIGDQSMDMTRDPCCAIVKTREDGRYMCEFVRLYSATEYLQVLKLQRTLTFVPAQCCNPNPRLQGPRSLHFMLGVELHLSSIPSPLQKSPSTTLR